jgi:cbb3-type cytochrome oxidase subunit 3
VLLAAGTAALDGIIVAAMVIPFLILGVICWIFWKAKQRDDAERARNLPPAR